MLGVVHRSPPPASSSSRSSSTSSYTSKKEMDSKALAQKNVEEKKSEILEKESGSENKIQSKLDSKLQLTNARTEEGKTKKTTAGISMGEKIDRILEKMGER